MVTVNELYENIGKLDSRTQQLKAQVQNLIGCFLIHSKVFRLEEENKNLVFEKSMIIEQLNDAFQEQTKLASALEEYEQTFFVVLNSIQREDQLWIC